MRGWWNVRRGPPDIEAALRKERPRPREEFVGSLAKSIADTPAPRRAGSRMAFAAAFTTFVVGSLVSFGGASYAAGGATNAFHAVKRVTAASPPKVQKRSAASAQYSNPTPPKPQKPKAQTVSGGIKGVASAPKSKPTAKTPAPPVVTKSQLPFTGLSLVTTSILGFALIALGILLRRRERREA